MSKRVTIARKYIAAGINVIPVGDKKRPVGTWKEAMEQMPVNGQIERRFSQDSIRAIGVVCGQVSGGIEVIDVDSKYDLTRSEERPEGLLWQHLKRKIVEADPDFMRDVVISLTGSGGYHLWYKCEVVQGNQKLAARYTTEEEKKAHPHEKVKCLIETRGQGGYIVAPPSMGYKWLQGNAMNGDVPVISPERRQRLLDICRSFNEVREEQDYPKGIAGSDKVGSDGGGPFRDYNERGDVLALLAEHGWTQVRGGKDGRINLKRPGDSDSDKSGDYWPEKKWFSVFSTSTEFTVGVAYKPAAVLCKLECGDDWKACYRKLRDMGYGIDNVKERGSDMAGEEANLFWEYNTRTDRFIFDYRRICEALNQAGFGLFFYDKKGLVYKLVRVKDNIIEDTSMERVRRFMKEYVLELDYEKLGLDYNADRVLRDLYKETKAFTDSNLEWLDQIKIDFLKDTPDECFIPFRNGMVRVSAGGCDLVRYKDIKGCLWSSSIIDFDIKIDDGGDGDRGDYGEFLDKISGGQPDSFYSAIGYLLHKYKSPARPFAVILGEQNEDDDMGGGAGKGVFCKALGKMVKMDTIDGKGFKPDKAFLYQRIDVDTRLMAIDDVTKYFKFDMLNSVISEGLTVEKKNKPEFFIEYEDSPKIVVTTNYGIDDAAVHAQRRMWLLEFTNYFSLELTPEQEFGRRFFDDWDNDEWNRFYNLMFHCVGFYLRMGVVKNEQGEGYKRKKIKSKFGESFLDWFDGYTENGLEGKKSAVDLYKEFLDLYGVNGKTFTLDRFTKAVIMSAKIMGYTFFKTKGGRSDRRNYYQLLPPGKQLKEEENCPF